MAVSRHVSRLERTSCVVGCHHDKDDPTKSPTPTLKSPDVSQNTKHCYNSGQKSSYGAIEKAAESFCNDVINEEEQGPVWSSYKLEKPKQPGHGYHFKISFEIYEGCVWTADYDECMRYLRVPIDSCDCSAKKNKQGGWVENNCIRAKIDPNKGILA